MYQRFFVLAVFLCSCQQPGFAKEMEFRRGDTGLGGNRQGNSAGDGTQANAATHTPEANAATHTPEAISGVLGVVEGFYWARDDAIRGQSTQYSHQQRQELLNYMGQRGRLNTYIYVPQLVDTMALWDDTDLAAWRATWNIALSQNIKLVLGLRPGFIDDLNATQNHVNNRAQQIMQSGIKDVVFAWDDVVGGGTLEQLTLQRDLVHETMHLGTHPHIRIRSVHAPRMHRQAWDAPLGSFQLGTRLHISMPSPACCDVSCRTLDLPLTYNLVAHVEQKAHANIVGCQVSEVSPNGDCIPTSCRHMHALLPALN